MKKFVLFSLFLFVCTGLSAMEAEESGDTSDMPSYGVQSYGAESTYGQLPIELDRVVTEFAPQGYASLGKYRYVEFQHVQKFPAEDMDIWQCAPSGDGRRIYFSFDEPDGREVKIVTNDFEGKELATYFHNDVVRFAQWSPDKQYIISCANDGSIYIVTAADGEIQAKLQLPRGPFGDNLIKFVAWSKDGNRIIFQGFGDTEVTEKSVVPVLLATRQLKNSTLSQHLLLKQLQKSLLEKEQSLVVGKWGHDTLDEMPEIKKLLEIEPSPETKKRLLDTETANQKAGLIWRLRLKRPADFVTKSDDKSEQQESDGGLSSCVIM